MPKKPAQKEIDAQIAKLQEIKPRVRRTSLFGDNHHDAIDAQIEVLENDFDEDQIYDDYGRDNVRDAALEARKWLDGEELDDGETPADGWKELM